MDKSGRLVVDAHFDSALPFRNHIAPVMLGEEWGLIDKSGKVVVEPAFERIYMR